MNPAASARNSAYLDAIDWMLPAVAEDSWLWEAGRHYCRGLFADMRRAARTAREEADTPDARRTSLIYEAIAAGAMGDYAAAADLLVEGRKLLPAIPILAVNMGVLLVKAGHWERAEESFALTTQLIRNEGAPWSYLSIIHLLKRDWSRAREAALEALQWGTPIAETVQLCLLNACIALGRAVDEAAAFPPASPPPEPIAGGEPAAAPSSLFEANAAQTAGAAAASTVFAVVLAADLADVAPMLWSLKAVQADCSAHLHVINATDETRRQLDRLAAQSAPIAVRWSSENLAAHNAGDLRRRVRMVRLERLREFLAVSRSPVLLADPEVLFRRAPGEWILPTAADPISLVHTPDALVEEQVSGRLAGFLPGERAQAFLSDALEACAAPLVREGRAAHLDQAALWAALWVACSRGDDEGIRRLSPAAALDEACGGEAGAWAPGAEAPMAAYSQFKAELEAAYGDKDAEPAPPAPPTNLLLQSSFGPMLVNRYDAHIVPAIRARGGGEVIEEIELLRQFIRPGGTVLDVGANMGTHTVPFCQAVGPAGKVFSFEPQRVIYQIMVANVALNSCLNAHCHRVAVGARRGRLRLPGIDYNRVANFGMMSFEWDWQLNPPNDLPGEEVEVITIDSLKLGACDLMKIDVEGMEKHVLDGAARTIRKHRPIIYMECFDNNDLGRAAIATLKAAGYRLFEHRLLGGYNLLCIPAARRWGVLGLREV